MQDAGLLTLIFKLQHKTSYILEIIYGRLTSCGREMQECHMIFRNVREFIYSHTGILIFNIIWVLLSVNMGEYFAKKVEE